MNRKQKIELIQSGKYVIKNDMIGDLRVLDVLNEFKKLSWRCDAKFYGIDSRGVFSGLLEKELNNRPHFLMIELVEVDSESKDVKSKIFDIIDYNLGGTYDKKQFCVNETLKLIHPTEPKEVFTVDSKKLDELYKEWSGVSHLDNSGKPIHDSSECTDFANYVIKYFKI